MRKSKKSIIYWKPPRIETISKKTVANMVVLSACSSQSWGCYPINTVRIDNEG